MGYMPNKRAEARSLENVSGRLLFRDSWGRDWLIEALPIGSLWRLVGPLANLIAGPGAIQWLVFLQRNLMAPEPGWTTRIRRWLGLPDFSLRYIGGNFPGRDRERLRDEIVKLNLDQTYGEYVKRVEEHVKKKMERRERASTGEA